MPVLFNDAIDDMPVLDRQAVFAQQRSNARANLLGESECALLQNVSTGSTGVCKSRRGFHHVATLPGSGTVQGAAFFDSSSENLVVVRGGTIYVLDSNYSPVNAHDLNVGNQITLSGVDAIFDGSHTVASTPSSSSFTVTRGSAFTASVSNKALTSNFATLTTATAHSLGAGNSVTVAGVDSTFNGSYLVSTTPTATTFTYVLVAGDVVSAPATGTVTVSQVSSTVSGGSFSVSTMATVAVNPYGTLSLDSVPITAVGGGSLATISIIPSFASAGSFLLDLRPSVACGGTSTTQGTPPVSQTVTNKHYAAGIATLTVAGHLYFPGDTLTISDVDSFLNGNITVASVTTNTFTYLRSLTPIATQKAIASGVATITTGSPHNLLVGDTVTATGAGGAFNGTYTIATVPTTTTFTYSRTVSATVANKSHSVGSATIETATDHNLLIGNTVAVSGVDDTFNGSYVVASVPTATTFTYARTLSSSITHKALASGAATLTALAAHSLAAGAVVTVSGVKDFNGTYTVVSVPTTTTLTFSKTLTKSLASRALTAGTTISLATAESYINLTPNNGSASNRASFAQIADKLFISTGGNTEKLVQISMATGSPEFSLSTETRYAHRLMVAQNFRLFSVANATTSLATNSSIYTSDFLPGTPTVFSGAVSFDVGQDYDDITALVAGTDFLLYVFKERSCYAIGTAPTSTTSTPTASSDFTIRQLSRDIGCVSARTVVQIGNDTFFLSRDGVRTLQRTLADGMTAIQPPISEPINDVIERINWDYAHTATAVYRDRKYILALPLDGAPAPSHVVVFDTAAGGWSMWTGVLPIDLINVSFGESKLLVVSSSTISEYRDYIKETNLVATDHQEKDSTGAYTSPTLKLISRALTFGEPLNPKTPDYIELEFDRGSNLRLDVSVILDNSDETLVAANLNTGGGSSVLLPVVLPFVLPKGAITRKRISLLGSGLTTLSALDDVNPAREMQVVITQAAGLTGGEAAQSKVLQIRGMVASAFVETLEVME